MTNDAKKAIEALKTALITAPVLRHPDFSKRDFVQCDVSDFGVGAILFEMEEDGSKAEPMSGEMQRYRKGVLRCCLGSETFPALYREDAIYSHNASL